jgi:hypothetical protein
MRPRAGWPDPRRSKAVDNGGLRYGAVEGALRPPLPTATQSGLSRPSFSAFAGPNPPPLDQAAEPKHYRRDPRKRTLGGRLQIGTVAGFGSESVAGFLLECMAGFVGIRIRAVDNKHETLLCCAGARAKGRCDPDGLPKPQSPSREPAKVLKPRRNRNILKTVAVR